MHGENKSEASYSVCGPEPDDNRRFNGHEVLFFTVRECCEAAGASLSFPMSLALQLLFILYFEV
jgi:hypothetical protein